MPCFLVHLCRGIIVLASKSVLFTWAFMCHGGIAFGIVMCAFLTSVRVLCVTVLTLWCVMSARQLLDVPMVQWLEHSRTNTSRLLAWIWLMPVFVRCFPPMQTPLQLYVLHVTKYVHCYTQSSSQEEQPVPIDNLSCLHKFLSGDIVY